MNAICERLVGTLRRELLDRVLIINEHHLRRALSEYLRHYNAARPHRSLGQLTPAQADTRPPEPVNLAEFRIRQKQVLGGLTHEYYIAALPPRAATGKRRSHPNRIFEPHTRRQQPGQASRPCAPAGTVAAPSRMASARSIARNSPRLSARVRPDNTPRAAASVSSVSRAKY